MNIHNKSTLIAYSRRHPEYKTRLSTWYNDVTEHYWKSAVDVKESFARASIINRHRVVFDIGTNCRIVTEINYSKARLFIKFIGSHSEYDRIDAATVSAYNKKSKN